MNVPVTVKGQRMFLHIGQHKLASGSQKFINFIFDLSDDWDGMTIFAQWVQGNESYNKYLDSNKSVTLPIEIKPGHCTMALYGNRSDNVIGTTLPVSLFVDDNHFVEDENSTDITQSLCEQLEAQIATYLPISRIATLAEVKSALGIT